MNRFAPPILVAVVTFAAFSPGLGGEFLNWDDDKNFLENPSYRGLGWENLRWMATTFLMGHWHPITWFTLGLDYTIWGMNPVGYHLTSLLIHSANAALLYVVLTAFLRLAGHPDLRWPAAIGALFYSLHPLRVESVSWITERRDVVCGLFTLLTILFYLRHVETDKDKWIILSCASFACALMSKALAITLPGALLLMDIYPLRRLTPENRRHVLLEKVPFFLLSIADACVMSFAMRHIDAVHSVVSYNFMERIAQAAYGLCFYVFKTVCPVGLAPLYRIDPDLNPWDFVYLASMVAVVASTALLVFRRRAEPGALATWLAYAGLVLPVLGVAVTGRQITADRYTYLALLPVSVLIARLLARADRPPVRIACGAVLLVLAAITVRQTLFWKDSMTLWNRELAIDPKCGLAYQNRGTVRQAMGDWTGAVADYDTSIALEPKEAQPWYNRGVAKATRGDHPGAIDDFNNAIHRYPPYVHALASRAISRARMNDRAGAMADCEEALRIDPRSLRAYANRGILRYEAGDLEGAVGDYTRALEIERSPDLYNNRGLAHFRSGRHAEAIADYSRSLELRPLHVETSLNRASARMASNDPDGAFADLTEAIRLRPDPAIILRRATLRGMRGDLAGTIADCTEAIRLKPDFWDAYGRRGVARLERGDRAGAAADLEKALQLAPPHWPQRRQIEDFLRQSR